MAAGLAGTLLLAAGIGLRRGAAVTLGLALAGGAYGASVVGGGVEETAAIAAGALLLVAELAYWSIEPAAPLRVRSAAAGRQAALAVLLAVGGGALAALLLALASSPLGGGAAVGFAGLAALVAVCAAAAGLLHSLRDRVE